MRAAPSPPSGPQSSPLESPAIQRILGALLEGYDYARDLKTTPWEFALDLGALLAEGCTPNALQWLVRKGYVDQSGGYGPKANGHKRRGGLNGRASEAARLILTDAGAVAARAVCAPPAVAARGALAAKDRAAERARPAWDGARGQLRYEGRLVRHFRNAASHQRAVLDALERAGWPERVPDPLPPPACPRVSRKRRLADVVKNLNRGHATRALHFYVTDCGRAVGWRRLG